MKYLSLVFLVMIAPACQVQKADNRTLNFPAIREKVDQLPEKEKLWIFILAGQSNMAGRGFVEPVDTVPNKRIFSLDEHKNWVYAKEPLHFYEPNLTGLDCGVSFAKALLKCIPEDISIGLVPCAVGGSAVAQWNNDEVYRGVKLLTNFRERATAVQGQGVIKGILWHQGESDGNSERIPRYREAVEELFKTFRAITKNDELPILVGELGAYMKPKETQENWDSINRIIHESADSDPNRFVISTKDLKHKGDHIHFNSKSQREIGRRFAREYLEKVLGLTPCL